METPGGVVDGRDSSPTVKCLDEMAGGGAGVDFGAHDSDSAPTANPADIRQSWNKLVVIVTTNMPEKFQMRDRFLWGAASAAYQVEGAWAEAVSYTHLRAHETGRNL